MNQTMALGHETRRPPSQILPNGASQSPPSPHCPSQIPLPQGGLRLTFSLVGALCPNREVGLPVFGINQHQVPAPPECRFLVV